jgi:hypothetical protein
MAKQKTLDELRAERGIKPMFSDEEILKPSEATAKPLKRQADAKKDAAKARKDAAKARKNANCTSVLPCKLLKRRGTGIRSILSFMSCSPYETKNRTQNVCSTPFWPASSPPPMW